ncbi:MAG: glycoside hydrolase family 97 C-terminal domain-containing protein [Rudanella sp.]|nr:glycoside hydrolase family 97 C-terminal domain-containing protein [Rudanella sp.]
MKKQHITKLLSAQWLLAIGLFGCSVTRKAKGKSDWFVGAITDENSRDLTLDLSFLEPGKSYEAVINRDAPNANWNTNPESYVIEKKAVTSQTKLTLPLAKGSGCAIQFIKR